VVRLPAKPKTLGSRMWRVDTLELVDCVLDFSSSGQAAHADKAIFADGAQLINAASLLDLANPAERGQVQICEDCGTTHCRPGGWILLRRVESNVLWLPCSNLMRVHAEASREYAPPRYEHGLPIFSAERYQVLREFAPEFPKPEDISLLRSREAIGLLQLDAPGRVLGLFPEQPAVRHDALLCSEPLQLSDGAALLEAVLASAWAVDEPVELANATIPITFRLDVPGTPAWSPIARTPLALTLSDQNALPNSGLQLTWPSLTLGPMQLKP
jgi:hypothetical protein